MAFTVQGTADKRPKVSFRERRDTPAIVKKGKWVSNFLQQDFWTT
jgi:hypothetical protein